MATKLQELGMIVLRDAGADGAEAVEKLIEEYETELARWRTRAATDRRGYEKFYERNRLLENAIRNGIAIGEHIDTDKLYALRTRVPKVPRKKWGWRS